MSQELKAQWQELVTLASGLMDDIERDPTKYEDRVLRMANLIRDLNIQFQPFDYPTNPTGNRRMDSMMWEDFAKKERGEK